MKSPCKGCMFRTVEPNCHMTCKDYLKYEASRKEIYKAKLDAMRCNGLLKNRRSGRQG